MCSRSGGESSRRTGKQVWLVSIALVILCNHETYLALTGGSVQQLAGLAHMNARFWGPAGCGRDGGLVAHSVSFSWLLSQCTGEGLRQTGNWCPASFGAFYQCAICDASPASADGESDSTLKSEAAVICVLI